MKTELPPDTAQKIEQYRAMLQRVVKIRDLITDKEVEVVEQSEFQKTYFAKMIAYEDAALEFNKRRTAALAATDSNAIDDWAKNANTYREKVRAAMADWITNGHKEEYEMIVAFIEQAERRSGGNDEKSGEDRRY